MEISRYEKLKVEYAKLKALYDYEVGPGGAKELKAQIRRMQDEIDKLMAGIDKQRNRIDELKKQIRV